jgi:Uncharacterized protein, possibly involved in utilization of glycolate and propanediol
MADFTTLARSIVDAAVRDATDHDMSAAIVVVDSSREVVAALRMDGSFPSTFTVALAKARTALNFERPTDVMKERVTFENRVALQGLGFGLAFLGGGEPIIVDGRILGALGVSGGSEDQDIACARAAVTGSTA